MDTDIRQELLCKMFGSAVLTMLKTATRMENEGKSAECQMNFCVWPILNEVKAKINLINKDALFIDDFEKVVG